VVVVEACDDVVLSIDARVVVVDAARKKNIINFLDQ
jgi:hypothetical protein